VAVDAVAVMPDIFSPDDFGRQLVFIGKPGKTPVTVECKANEDDGGNKGANDKKKPSLSLGHSDTSLKC
jgi:hypothetical protein